MQQEAFVPGESRPGAVCNYVHETIELHLSLSRGTELVPLGTASIVVSGEEEGEIQMHVPAKPILHKSKNLNPKRLKSKFKTNPNKYGYFSGDPTNRFYLGENATLRIGVQVIPQGTLKIAEAREKQELNLKTLLERIGDENLKKNEENPTRNFSLANLKTALPISITKQQQPPTPPGAILPNFFCGAMMYTARPAPAPEPKKPDIPSEVVHTLNEFKYQYGVASIMSSVSESTYGSYESDDEIEDQIQHL
jgi:hypothetical protein